MRKPLIVYLDTQDYSNLYNIKSDEIQTVFDYLCKKVDRREIVIPYSYFIIAELLTEFTHEYKEDRLKRVAVVNRLCGTNAMGFINPNMSIGNVLSENGKWYPEFEIWKKFKEGIDEQASRLVKSLPKSLAKKVNMKKPWPQLFKIFPTLTKSISQVSNFLPVPKSFSESHLLVRYLKGEVSQKVIETELEKVFTDLNLFFTFWFENDANANVKLLHEIIQTVGNPFLQLANDFIKTSQLAKDYLDIIHPISTTYNDLKIETSQEFKVAKKTLSDFQKLDLDFVKSFLPDKSILEKLPDHFIDTILSYAIGNMRANRKVQDSDTGDLMHACYLPFCDIWRGDISFCNLLTTQKVDGYEKTVNRLSLLPTVIESKLTPS